MKIELCELSIIIVNWNNAKLTKNCIESIFKNTNNLDYEIILVDNGSTESSSWKLMDYYDKHPLIKTVRTGYNYGFAGGNNRGLKYAKGKYFLLLNNDTIVQKENWFVSPIKVFENDWKTGIIGASGGYHDAKFKFVQNYSSNKIKEVEYVEGWAFFFRRQLYNRIGGLDEDFFLLCEDSDYCFKAKKLGYKTVICPLPIHHLGSQSLKKSETPISFLAIESRNILMSKHTYPVLRAKEKNILCVRYEARGDVFLCLPAVRELRKLHSDCFIHFLTHPVCQEVLKNEYNCIDKLWIRNSKELKELSKIKFEKIINFQDHNKYSNDIKSFFSKTFLGRSNPLMQNTRESQQLRGQEGKKYIDIFADIANVKLENDVLDFPLTKKNYRILEKHYLKKWKYLAISLDSGWQSRHFGRTWIEEFCKVCRNNKILVVLLGTDTALKRVENCINLIKQTTIAEAKAVIENSSCFLTIDSLLLHIAQTIINSPPIICLFTATPCNYVVSNKIKVTSLEAKCKCSPCYYGHCKEKERYCLQEFNPQFILEKIKKYFPKIIETIDIGEDMERVERKECPVCNSKIIRKIDKKMSYKIYKCQNCQMKFAQNPLIQKEYKEIYNEESLKRLALQPTMKIETQYLWSFLDQVTWETMNKKGDFLDIGCSCGAMLSLAKNNKWNEYGIDLSSEAVIICKHKGLQAENTTIEEFVSIKKFNLITLIDVIEHVENILKTIEKIKNLFANNGILMVTTPIKKLGHFATPTHINYFTYFTLINFLEKQGFEILSVNSHKNKYNVIIICRKAQ